MDDWDWERLRLDWYLTRNAFARRERRTPHPWQTVEDESLIAARAKRFYTHMNAALDKMCAPRRGGKFRARE